MEMVGLGRFDERTGYENERRWRAGSDIDGGFGTICATGSRR